MSNYALAAMGILAGIVGTVAMVPYVVDIFRGKTKPERATWWIWFAINAEMLVAQWAAGGSWSLIFTGEAVIATAFVSILSIRYGYGRLKRRDYASFALAGVGLGLWWFTSEPGFAIGLVIFVDALATMLTVLKIWEAPWTETAIAWVLSGCAALLNALSVGKVDARLLSFPIYVVLMNAIVITIMYYRRKLTHMHQPPPPLSVRLVNVHTA
jgi:hypothetical protein